MYLKHQLIENPRYSDERGFLSYALDVDSYASLLGKETHFSVLYSHNRLRGTVRGMHFQLGPAVQHKFVWCTSGHIIDVLVDIRPDSVDYKKVFTYELQGADCLTIEVPDGYAHGYQTLTDESVVNYAILGEYNPTLSRTLLWSDPEIHIDWPSPVTVISDKDANGCSWAQLFS